MEAATDPDRDDGRADMVEEQLQSGVIASGEAKHPIGFQ
jgi:hypothetical protein